MMLPSLAALRRSAVPTLLLCLMLSTPAALAWDAAAHRYSAAIAYELLPLEYRSALRQLLQQHPRFREDFLKQMPAYISSSSEAAQTRWLLGQAALWPDLVRGLPEDLRNLYNHPRWHYIDGRWMPSAAASALLDEPALQGNVYLGRPALSPLRDRQPQGRPDNMMEALDHSLGILGDDALPGAERAVALCWVLHLLGDIHQPLHAGALMTAGLFVEGDRGGNGIRTPGGNLHSLWDQALRALPAQELVQEMLAEAARIRPRIGNSALWLQESRSLLHSAVYTGELRDAILRSEDRGESAARFEPDEDYIGRMQDIARQRVLLAGIRLAAVLQQ